MRHPLPERHTVLPSPVLIVEDEPLLQQRLQRILLGLGYTPNSLLHAANLNEARAHLSNQSVALALVDLMLPDGSGLDLIAQIRSESPDMGILVVSAWSSEESILSALRAGATGYVLKERDDLEVSMLIRSVLRGGAPIDPFIARRILQLLLLDERANNHPVGSATTATEVTRTSSTAHNPKAPATLPLTSTQTHGESLSDREEQILRLVADGLTNREIAECLFLSRHTVESHIKRIYRKLAVSSRTMAVRAGRSRGVIE